MRHQTLSYPVPTPERGHFGEVVPGVQWIRLPLPYRLNHINVWGLADGDGWTLVDTGARTEETLAVWERLLAAPPFDRPLTRVLVTHMHPDHIGMAGWITRRYGVKLWISRLEYLTCRTLVSDTSREAPEDAIEFYRQAGWSRGAIDSYRARFGNFGKHVHALPDSFHRLEDRDVVRIGGSDWEVVGGNGHSPEHSCLHCPDLKILISGDQVLPKISSNVSVHPTEPDANPMADWLRSLDQLEQRVPGDVLVLPAHGDCFVGLHARIDQLRTSQQAALERLEARLDEPRRVIDVFPALFNRPIEESDQGQLHLATGEALACLNYLVDRGSVAKELRGGVAWYRRA